MAYNQMVSASRILTTGATEGQVLTVDSGGTSASFADYDGMVLGSSGEVTLANNATTTITHAAVSRPIIVTGEAENLGANAPDALLHFDGADGGTTIDDTGSNGGAHSWSVHGNVQLDTAKHKFGSASLLFDGTGDYLTAADHADWAPGTNDFYCRFWFWPNTVKTLNYLVDTRATGTGPGIIVFQDSGTLRVYLNGSEVITGSAGLTSGDWNYIEVSRVSGTLRLFKNGVSIGSASNSTNLTNNKMLVGRAMNDTSGDIDGWLDEFEWNVGTGGNTSTYTPPTTETPDYTPAGYTQLCAGIDFTVMRNTAGTQTTITNISGGSLTAIFTVRK